MSSFEALDKVLKTYLIDQKYVNTGLYLFLILYAGLAAPKLPSYVANLFNNMFFRVLILFLIAYLGGKDVQAAILVSIGLVVTLITINNHKTKQQMNVLLNTKKEGFRPDTVEDENYLKLFPIPQAPVKPVPQEPQQPKRVMEGFNAAFEGSEYATF